MSRRRNGKGRRSPGRASRAGRRVRLSAKAAVRGIRVLPNKRFGENDIPNHCLPTRPRNISIMRTMRKFVLRVPNIAHLQLVSVEKSSDKRGHDFRR